MWRIIKGLVGIYDEVAESDFVGIFEHYCPLDYVFELADVAGPEVVLYFFGGQFCKALDLTDFVGAYIGILDKIISQDGNVFFS